MNKRYIVFGAAAIMLGLIFVAFALDCVRLAKASAQRVELADRELAKHEQRLVKLLAGSPTISPEVQAAIAVHEAAATRVARHAAYDHLVSAFRRTMGTTVDPTNPLDRKFMDEAAGALNRREIAEPPYDAEATAYRAYMNSPRGAVARWCAFPAGDSDDSH